MQYQTGTVSVTNGSQTVTGSGTTWSTAGLSVGDIFTVANVNATYEVGSIDSDTQITLTANYAGATGSGLTYAITTDFTTTYGIPVPYKGDIEMASIIRRAFTKIDNEFILTSSGGTIDGDLNVDGTVTADGLTVDGNVSFGDNDKAIFGAGSDLQIYHDGVDTYITESGAGSLIIKGNFLQLQSPQGEMFIDNVANGAVTLYYDNAAKLATTSTGIDVTGTVTADGLTVDGSTALRSTSAFSTLNFYTQYGSQNTHALIVSARADTSTTASNIQLYTNDGTSTKLRAKFHNQGDISFYEDTGTTAKFFWDASAESLGIGGGETQYQFGILNAGNASAILRDTSDSSRGLRLRSGTAGNPALIDTNSASKLLALGVNGSEAMRIDSSGNLLVGTTSAIAKLTVNGGISASGVYLGGTGSANYLDDYEEGTFTATLRLHSDPTNTTTTDTGVNVTGYYTKIGDVCHVSVWWNVSSYGNYIAKYIQGLPFTSASNPLSNFALYHPRGVMHRYNATTESVCHLTCTAGQNSTNATLHSSAGAYTSSGWWYLMNNAVGKNVGISGTYKVA